jgi:hypothetical protein
MTKASYLITSSEMTLDIFASVVQCDRPDLDIRRNVSEFSIRGPSYSYCNFQLETRDRLLDEWYPDDPIINLLLCNSVFKGHSNAFYGTFNYPASPEFVAAVLSVVKAGYDCLIFNCHELFITGRLFLSTVSQHPDWQWHYENSP